ncbi:MAG: hypothetical protein A2W99_13535 [Bacteroidetes bacterium GWF2_33_16]|nr:MAG: hypothetical protein A2X00_08190 [Bacteroidetes bacterium GWE2_32_14]OFY06697.1 MAG: hypothetical protein A2W99_13535 [Bacteroidetes bacterium GWF2_33_16]
MKKTIAFLLAIAILIPAFTGCDEDETDKAPELPPYESMVIDFSNFSGDAKATPDLKTTTNFGWAALTVYFWNVTVGSVIAVPVAAFYTSFNQTPTYLGDKKWQWSYTVNGFAGAYTARLTGEVRTDDVKWEMYITKIGIGAYPEFKWFEGTSSLDRNTGQWTLYHSYQYQEEVLVIDWLRIDGEFSQITYTYVRELNDNRVTEDFNGSYLTYGLQTGDYDAYYTVHAYAASISEFADTYIEWNTTQFYGHIKADHIYQDTNWHCWDTLGNDVNCTN